MATLSVARPTNEVDWNNVCAIKRDTKMLNEIKAPKVTSSFPGISPNASSLTDTNATREHISPNNKGRRILEDKYLIDCEYKPKNA